MMNINLKQKKKNLSLLFGEEDNSFFHLGILIFQIIFYKLKVKN